MEISVDGLRRPAVDFGQGRQFFHGAGLLCRTLRELLRPIRNLTGVPGYLTGRLSYKNPTEW